MLRLSLFYYIKQFFYEKKLIIIARKLEKD